MDANIPTGSNMFTELERELDKVTINLRSLRRFTAAKLSELLHDLSESKKDFSYAFKGPFIMPRDKDMVNDFELDVKILLLRIVKFIMQIKRYHWVQFCNVEYIGVCMNRILYPNPADLLLSPDLLCQVLPTYNTLMPRLILMHLHRRGLNGAMNALIQEGQMSSEAPFLKLMKTYVAIRRSILDRATFPALQWLAENSEKMSPYFRIKARYLQFKLHVLTFLSMSLSNRVGAIAYARISFRSFSQDPDFQQEIGVVMSALLYPHKFEEMISPDCWKQIERLHHELACHLLKVPCLDPLVAAVDSGCAAIPCIQRYPTDRPKINLWGEGIVLPMATPLPEHVQFHSVYVCHITRQGCDKDNPAMLLRCRHVLSKDGVDSVLETQRQENNPNAIIKCPFCSRLSRKDTLKEITF